MPIPMTVIWGAAMVVFLIVEGVTVGLTSIWFAVGALAALLSAAFGAPLWLQIVWFIVISIVTLVLTRPLARKYVNSRRQATNADRMIGMVGRVTEDIDNIAGTGTVHLGSKLWSARAAEDAPIAAGTLVRAEAISGVKLIVRPEEAPQPAGGTDETQPREGEQ